MRLPQTLWTRPETARNCSAPKTRLNNEKAQEVPLRRVNDGWRYSPIEGNQRSSIGAAQPQQISVRDSVGGLGSKGSGTAQRPTARCCPPKNDVWSRGWKAVLLRFLLHRPQ